MVAPKNDVLVKEDGTYVALLQSDAKVDLDGFSTVGTSEISPKKRPQRFHSAIVIIVCLVVLSAVGCIILLKSDFLKCGNTTEFKHTIHYVYRGEIHTEDIVLGNNSQFNQEDDGSKSIHDLETGFGAIVTFDSANGHMCLIYNSGVAIESERDLEAMYAFIEQSNEELDTVFDDRDLVAMSPVEEDDNDIPQKLYQWCEGAVMYKTKERSKKVKRQINENIVPESEVNRGTQDRDRQNAANILPPHLNVGAGESDHGKACCQYCRRGYLHCQNVCTRTDTTEYPYFYEKCDYRRCFVIMPCSWWYQRALGGN